MKSYYDSMVETILELVSHNTVQGEPAENAPFGLENRICLSRVLELGKEMGFETKDVEGYAGHIEWKGKTDEILGILGHLDVVPVGSGWSKNPFGEIADGVLYGRGVMDDKGPMIACLYAMKKLKDEGFVPTKTIRLIFGCNEENGNACIKRYLKTETMPTVAFSPDGDFPCIHSEKAMAWLRVDLPCALNSFKSVYGGDKVNCVAASCSALYTGDKPADFFISRGFTAEKADEGLQIVAKGVSAHGSTPALGDNAAWKILKLIDELNGNPATAFVAKYLCSDCNGKALGIYREEITSGDTTLNLGTVKYENGLLSVELDVRFPINITQTEVEEALAKFAPKNATVTDFYHHKALYVDPTSPLVTTLVGIFNKHTGRNEQSMIIGGGTYARELTCGVAFGPMFSDMEVTIHQKDERVKLSDLYTIFDIYLDAIKQLAE